MSDEGPCAEMEGLDLAGPPVALPITPANRYVLCCQADRSVQRVLMQLRRVAAKSAAEDGRAEPRSSCPSVLFYSHFRPHGGRAASLRPYALCVLVPRMGWHIVPLQQTCELNPKHSMGQAEKLTHVFDQDPHCKRDLPSCRYYFPTGAIFEDEKTLQEEEAFRYAVDQINADRTILPKARLVPRLVHLDKGDPLLAIRKVGADRYPEVRALNPASHLWRCGVNHKDHGPSKGIPGSLSRMGSPVICFN
ncbi:Glutamate receptor ionotropic, delta-1 [Branchiostoma belcheri]|nr:Glutamate receptor ionotropic, delta-1 [Branchiostoma belcheri]